MLMVNLLASEGEYQRVAHMFYSTGGRGNIISIERVQNLCLYKQYSTYRQEVERRNCRSGFNNQNERQLFHGTKGCNVRAINLQGFNRNFCGLNGKLHNWHALFKINCHGESRVRREQLFVMLSAIERFLVKCRRLFLRVNFLNQ